MADRAESLTDQGKYGEASRVLRTSLGARRKADLETADRARLLCLLGIVCKADGQFDQGARAYREAGRALASILPPGSPEFATIQHNLGGIEHERRRFARAEVHARRSVAIRSAALGPRHPDTIADLSALAAILHDRKDHAGADRILTRAVRYYRARVKENRRTAFREDLAAALHNLAAVSAALGRDRRAMACYREAIELKRAHFGSPHPEVAVTLNNFAVLHMRRGEWARAELLLREAVAMAGPGRGRGAPRHAIAERNLRTVLARSARARADESRKPPRVHRVRQPGKPRAPVTR